MPNQTVTGCARTSESPAVARASGLHGPALLKGWGIRRKDNQDSTLLVQKTETSLRLGSMSTTMSSATAVTAVAAVAAVAVAVAIVAVVVMSAVSPVHQHIAGVAVPEPAGIVPIVTARQEGCRRDQYKNHHHLAHGSTSSLKERP